MSLIGEMLEVETLSLLLGIKVGTAPEGVVPYAFEVCSDSYEAHVQTLCFPAALCQVCESLLHAYVFSHIFYCSFVDDSFCFPSTSSAVYS